MQPSPKTAKSHQPRLSSPRRRRRDPKTLGGFRVRRRVVNPTAGLMEFGVTDDRHVWYVARHLGQGGPLPAWRRAVVGERARLLRGTDSPRVQPVVAMDLESDAPWRVCPYPDGRDLSHHLSVRGALDERRVRLLAVGVAEALSVIHRAGVTHGDLYPGNVHLTQDGPVVGGVVEGPEGERDACGADPALPLEIGPDDPATPASDVFSWGLVVLAAATGTELLHEDQEVLPFGLDEDDDVSAALQRFRERFRRALDDGTVNLDGVPQDLRGLVAAALSPRESDRPTAEHLLAVLSGSAAHPELDPHEVVREAMAEHWTETPTTLETRPGYLTPRQRVTRLVLLLVAVAVGLAARHLQDRPEEDTRDVGAAAVLSAQPSAHPHTPASHRSATTTVQ